MMNTSGKFILNSIYFENHEYLMRRGNISGTREIRKCFIYIDAGCVCVCWGGGGGGGGAVCVKIDAC